MVDYLAEIGKILISKLSSQLYAPTVYVEKRMSVAAPVCGSHKLMVVMISLILRITVLWDPWS